MNTLPHETPTDWADSMAHWAEENAAELKHFTGSAHRALRLPAEKPSRAFVPQGCTQQGRQEPTIPVAKSGFVFGQDRLPEDYDKPEPLTRKESARFWAVAMAPGIALLGVVGFAIWARFGHVF